MTHEEEAADAHHNDRAACPVGLVQAATRAATADRALTLAFGAARGVCILSPAGDCQRDRASWVHAPRWGGSPPPGQPMAEAPPSNRSATLQFDAEHRARGRPNRHTRRQPHSEDDRLPHGLARPRRCATEAVQQAPPRGRRRGDRSHRLAGPASCSRVRPSSAHRRFAELPRAPLRATSQRAVQITRAHCKDISAAHVREWGADRSATEKLLTRLASTASADGETVLIEATR